MENVAVCPLMTVMYIKPFFGEKPSERSFLGYQLISNQYTIYIFFCG